MTTTSAPKTSTSRRVSSSTPAPQQQLAETHRNEVVLWGRVSSTPVTREMPSGDLLVFLRIVVDRPVSARRDAGRRQVDAIDLACWTARARAAATRVVASDLVEVHGALRRRFYRAGAAVASRHEVEVHSLRRIREPGPSPPAGGPGSRRRR